jgi:hypothetical protein
LELYLPAIDRAQINYAITTWYFPREQHAAWRQQAGNRKQMELTEMISNLDHVKIDKSIFSGRNWGPSAILIKLIGWNAERGNTGINS